MHLGHHAAPGDDVDVELGVFGLLMGGDRVEQAVKVVISCIVELAKCIEACIEICREGRRVVVPQAGIVEAKGVRVVVGEACDLLQFVSHDYKRPGL